MSNMEMTLSALPVSSSLARFLEDPAPELMSRGVLRRLVSVGTWELEGRKQWCQVSTAAETYQLNSCGPHWL